MAQEILGNDFKIWNTIIFSYRVVFHELRNFIKIGIFLIIFMDFFVIRFGYSIADFYISDVVFFGIYALIMAHFSISWLHKALLGKTAKIAQSGGDGVAVFLMFLFMFWLKNLPLYDAKSTFFLLESFGVDRLSSISSNLSILVSVTVFLLVAVTVINLFFFQAGIAIGDSLSSIARIWPTACLKSSKFYRLHIAGFVFGAIVFAISILISAHILRPFVGMFSESLLEPGQALLIGINSTLGVEIIMSLFSAFVGSIVTAANITAYALYYVQFRKSVVTR